MARDDFTLAVKEVLSKRVALQCSRLASILHEAIEFSA